MHQSRKAKHRTIGMPKLGNLPHCMTAASCWRGRSGIFRSGRRKQSLKCMEMDMNSLVLGGGILLPECARYIDSWHKKRWVEFHFQDPVSLFSINMIP